MIQDQKLTNELRVSGEQRFLNSSFSASLYCSPFPPPPRGGGRVEDVVVARAVFESSHFDDNNVQSISHKCRVIKSSDKTDEHYDYCTVGHFDPVEGSVKIYDDQS